MKKYGYLLAFILPAVLVWSTTLGGPYIWTTLALVFVAFPLLDYMVGLDTSNQNEKSLFFTYTLYTWVAVQIGLILWGMYFSSTRFEATWWKWLVLLVSTAVSTGGIGITIAHELGHKKNKLAQALGKTLLMTTCYMHFHIEHNKGHHVRVGTHQDPATSRKGEHFYAFFIRSVVMGYISAWNIETSRLKRKGLSNWTSHNKMIGFAFLPFIFFAIAVALLFWFGVDWHWNMTIFFFGQAFFAVLFLELVNYIEHYGLKRSIKNGQIERVSPMHSWNSSFLLSNFLLFQLQRHSDHHATAIRPYQNLQHHDISPQLPAGYPTMVLLALIPPIWFKTMNKLLLEYQRIST